LESWSLTMVFSRFLLESVTFAATSDLMENDRSASKTESVPSALSFLPVNGKTSGPRCAWQLIFTRLTRFTKGSISFETSIGSSLKFCIVAEGKADIYPRVAPTSEWDTAAGHAVLLAAGGLVDGTDGEPLHYGKKAFLNRAFVATAGWKPPSLKPFLEPFSGGGELPVGS